MTVLKRNDVMSTIHSIQISSFLLQYGRTALHYACAIAHGGDIEDALVNAGADTELEDLVSVSRNSKKF